MATALDVVVDIGTPSGDGADAQDTFVPPRGESPKRSRFEGFRSEPVPLRESSSQRSVAKDPPTTFVQPFNVSRTPAGEITKNFHMRYGVHSIQGKRPKMEDAHRIIRSTNTIQSPKSRDTDILEHSTEFEGGGVTHEAFFGVFDGHAGQECADYAARNLATYLTTNTEFAEGRYLEAMRLAFEQTEEEWIRLAEQRDMCDGTTAVVALIAGSTLVVGNVGDSEAVLCRNGEAVLLSTAHNCKKNPAEEARVLASGGRVYHHRVGHPVWNPALISIGVSRAIGDLSLKQGKYTENKPSGLIAQPDLIEVQLTDTDTFLILACDGLWDVVTYQEGVDFVASKLADHDPTLVTQLLCDLAYAKGSTDNITALVVSFHFPRSVPPSPHSAYSGCSTSPLSHSPVRDSPAPRVSHPLDHSGSLDTETPSDTRSPHVSDAALMDTAAAPAASHSAPDANSTDAAPAKEPAPEERGVFAMDAAPLAAESG